MHGGAGFTPLPMTQEQSEAVVLMLKNSTSTNAYNYYYSIPLALYSLQKNPASERQSVPFLQHRGLRENEIQKYSR